MSILNLFMIVAVFARVSQAIPSSDSPVAVRNAIEAIAKADPDALRRQFTKFDLISSSAIGSESITANDVVRLLAGCRKDGVRNPGSIYIISYHCRATSAAAGSCDSSDFYVVPNDSLLVLSRQRARTPGCPPPAPPAPPPTFSLFSDRDYPAEALKKRWEGDVIADLIIDTRGHVRECRLVQSSGHEVLDQATCDIFRRRARFTPAKDTKGNLIEDTYRTHAVRWRIQR